MTNRNIVILLVLAIIVAGIFIWFGTPKSSTSSFVPVPVNMEVSEPSMASELPRTPPRELNYKPGFLPSHQGPWFQNLPPSLRVENAYHSCIQENGGDYGDYELRQKCYIKTLKDGTHDKADLMCWRYRHDENLYYRCLDSVYGGGNNWMDRGTSTGFCWCEDGAKGVLKADGSCFCPSYRPLHDRREVDENDEIVYRM